MSEIIECDKCNGWYINYGRVHKCEKFEVHIPEYTDPGEPMIMYESELGEHGFEAVARRAAERWDSGEYDLLNGSTVQVRVERGGKVKWFEVSGEVVPSYNAATIPPPKDEEEYYNQEVESEG